MYKYICTMGALTLHVTAGDMATARQLAAEEIQLETGALVKPKQVSARFDRHVPDVIVRRPLLAPAPRRVEVVS